MNLVFRLQSFWAIYSDLEKVKAIVCARAPTNVSELRGS